MPYSDLREFMKDLDKHGELMRIKREVKLEPDIGAMGAAIAEMNDRDINAPAILCEKIYGCDLPLAIGLQSSYRRTAIAYGLPPDSGFKELKKAWMKGYEKYPVKSRTVTRKNAPCKENIVKGKDINIFRFPIPRINTEDAGPYLLKPLCITRDTESDWVNFGMYRMQVLDRDRCSLMTSHVSHWGEHYIKHRRQGKPMPMVVAMGTDPVLGMVSGAKVPSGWNEYDFAGAIRGEPCEIIKAETCDLPVPATAEIVLEGEVSVEANVYEGPFGEWTGSYSGMLVMPTFHVTCMTFRNNPIFDTVTLSKGASENAFMTMPGKIAALEQELRHILPNMTEIAYSKPIVTAVVVQGKWGNKTEPRRAMNAVWASQAGQGISKIVTVVDDDIDPWDSNDVLWAIGTRTQANVDTVIIPGAHSRLDPSAEADGTSCLFGIDATKSREPFPRHSIACWIEPRKERHAWKEEILRYMKGGKK
ncbi:MAG: UbiD family decarboxylase [Chloroflexi bacterium]|nr:UbiD family decarboxylase [Chloroflexota bacterium]